jgi:hypothetical protein
MLDRSQYQKFQTQYSSPQPSFSMPQGGYSSKMVESLMNANYGGGNAGGGGGYTPTPGYDYVKRPDTLSAGVADWTDSLKGYGKGISEMLPEGMMGSVDANGIKTEGWGGLALGAGKGIMDAFMGMKNYGLAREAFDFKKDSYATDLKARQGDYNSQIEDRQKARVAANSNAQSVDSYMQKNRMG